MSKKLTSGITGTITAPGATDAIPITDNSGAPELKKITWASLTAKVVPYSLMTAKGDLIAATGSAAVDNLAVGTDYYGLHADSSQTMGLVWAPDPYGIEHNTVATEKSNTNAEQTLWSKAVTWPIYVGSSNRMLHIHAMLNMYNDTGGNVVYTYRLKYGAATYLFSNITMVTSGANYGPNWFDGYIIGNGSASSQFLSGYIRGNSTAGVSGVRVTGTVDSTAAVTISLTCTMDTASASAKNNVLFSRLVGYAP